VDPTNADPTFYQITGNQMTVEAWIHPTMLPEPGDTMLIVGRPAGGATGWQSRYVYRLQLVNDGVPRVEYTVTDGGANVGKVSTDVGIAAGRWTHVAGVYNGGNLAVLTDGVQRATSPTFTSLVGAGFEGLYVGGLSRHFFQGAIDELRLWSVPRTATDIQNTMNELLEGTEPNLAGYWQLDDSSTVNNKAGVTLDLSPGNNHLFVEGTAGFFPAPAAPFQQAGTPSLASAIELYGVANQPFTFGPLFGGGPGTIAALTVGGFPSGMTYDDVANLVTWTPQDIHTGYQTFTLEADNATGPLIKQDYTIFVDEYPVDYQDHNTNKLTMSVFNNGRVGYDMWERTGNGIVYPGTESNWPANGSLIIATSTNQVSGRISTAERSDYSTHSNVEGITSFLPGFDQAYEIFFDDDHAKDGNGNPNPIGISVTQRTHSKSTGLDNDYVILDYTLTNQSGATLNGLYVGLAVDWDVGDATNMGGYDDSRDLVYIYNPPAAAQTDTPHVGTTLLKGGPVSGRYLGPSLLNDEAEIYGLMKTSEPDPVGEQDLRALQAVGPIDNLLDGAEVRVVFAVLGGDNIADLQANAVAAQAAFKFAPTAETYEVRHVSTTRATLFGGVHPNGLSTNVTFYWGTESGNLTQSSQVQPPLTGTEMVTVAASADNLQAGMTYFYQVEAVNADGSSTGDEYSFSTPAVDEFTRITDPPVASDDAMSSGISWNDYDGDGYPDLYVANTGDPPGEGNFLYHNQAGASFESAPTAGPVASDVGMSITGVWGDYDNDGDLDLFVANWGQANVLYQNVNNGVSFTPIHAPFDADVGFSNGASWADYNGDGDLDLFVVNAAADEPNFLYDNSGPGGQSPYTFTRVTGAPWDTDMSLSRTGAWADYDNDGDLDLFVANSGNRTNFLYTNEGLAQGYTFTPVQAELIVTDTTATMGASWGDYDNDGDLDLFVANAAEQANILYRNNGNGNFDKPSAGNLVTDEEESRTGAWADYDNDGDLDLFVTNDGDNALYVNTGGVFSNQTTGLLVTNGTYSYGAAWGDYDRDGNLDLAVANRYDNNLLYHNQGVANNHWVNLRLVGTGSNVSAIGSQVRLRAEGSVIWQLRQVTSQSGWSSQSSLSAEFGLGQLTHVDSVVIRWPSGNEQSLSGFKADSFVTVNEVVPEPPPTAVTNPATSVTTTSAILHGTVNPNNQKTAVTFEYGTTTDYGTPVNAVEDSLSGSSDQAVTAPISGLTHNTTYHFRVVADNPSGKVYGADEVFTTEEVQLATVTTLPATSVSSTSATLNGIVNPKGENTSVTFEWGTTLDLEKPPIAADQGTINASTDVPVTGSLSEADLELDTRYYFRVSATNLAGTASGAQNEFTTPADTGITTDVAVVVGDGEVNLPGTDMILAITFTSQTGEDTIEVSQNEDAPTGTLPVNVDLVATTYWEIDHYGEGEFSVDMTLDLSPDTVSAADQAEPGNIKLLRRDDESVENWAVVASASAATRTTVTFAGLTGFSQFTVGSEIQGVAPTVTTNAPSAVEEVSAVLHGTVNPGGLNTTVSFNWGETTAYGTTVDAEPDNQVSGDADVQVRYTLTGLDPWQEYHYRIEAVNSQGLVEGADQQFTTLDEQNPAILATTIAAGQPPLDVDVAITITAVITDNVGVDQVTLHHAPGGAPSYSQQVTMLPTATADEYSGEIPSGAVTLRGVVCYVRAADPAGNDSLSAPIFIPVRFNQGVLTTSSVTNSAYDSGFPKDQWRLMSIPAELTQPQVNSTIGDDMGVARHDTSWRVYEYTGNSSNPWAEPSTFEAGESFWLKQRVVSNVELVTGAGRNNNLQQFPIELDPGWTMIGTPYCFRTPIQLDDIDFWGPFTHDGGGWLLNEEELNMDPWGGYIVYNRTSSVQILTLTAEPGGGVSKEILAKAAAAEPPVGWVLELQAEGRTYHDRMNAIGRLDGALEGLDHYDNPEPPYVDGYVSLAMERPDWNAHLTQYSSDIRSLQEQDGVWDMDLSFKRERGPVDLSYNLRGDFPVDHKIILLDVLTREVYDLSAGENPAAITQYREDFPYHLKVVAGSANYVDQTTEEILAALPNAFALSQNYPNPFNPVTNLRYSLYRPAKVTMKIFNLLGQEVITLVDDWHDLGHYTVAWNGRDRFGNQLASGIYIAAYMAEGKIYSRKMVMMK
jgi:phosphodiesterase/alkaline phosphatase D-like protein